MATICFWLVRHYLDKGLASLLYLTVVIACGIRFGFGPAMFGAVLSFLCWDFFFLPPFGTLNVTDYKDWISLGVFLGVAAVTARLEAQSRDQTRQARMREREILTLHQASEVINQEVDSSRLLPTLTAQLRRLCGSENCVVFVREGSKLVAIASADEELEAIRDVAQLALERNLVIGFGRSADMWSRALRESSLATHAEIRQGIGAYVPLHTEEKLIGVLYIGPRRDGQEFTPLQERLILTLANHAAVVIARQALAVKAAQTEALREADALKDSLLSLASHELRSPLASIKATLTGLLQPDAVYDEETRRQALASISSQADRLSALVSNMLDLSRIEAGAWKPQKDWCDIEEIVGTALDRLSDEEAARVQVQAAIRASANSCRLHADRAGFVQHTGECGKVLAAAEPD